MVFQFDNLDQLAVGAGAGDFQAVGGEQAAVLVVQLESVPVPFGNR